MPEYRILWGHGGSPAFEAENPAAAVEHANDQPSWRGQFNAIYGVVTFRLRDLQVRQVDQWGNGEWVPIPLTDHPHPR